MINLCQNIRATVKFLGGRADCARTDTVADRHVRRRNARSGHVIRAQVNTLRTLTRGTFLEPFETSDE